MTTAALNAAIVLEDLYFNHLHSTRARFYDLIEEFRDLARIEQETTLILKDKIRIVGEALTEARERGLGPGDAIYDSLVTQVRSYNHERADNRYRVREIAEQQAMHKAALAELNRELSVLDLTDEEFVHSIIHFH